MKRRILSLITTLALCLNLCPVWASAADEGTGEGLCPHHLEHTSECGYAQEDSDALCTFVCKICPINDLISELPDSVSMDNGEQIEAQLSKIYDLYNGLTEDEQQQVDLSLCVSLRDQLDEADAGTQTGSDSKDYIYHPVSDMNLTDPFEVAVTGVIDTNGYTLLWTVSDAIRVTETGKLYLKGKIQSKIGTGIEVKSGGFLSVEGADTVILGSSYGLDVASDATIRLSGGTFTGRTGAAIRIQTKNGETADFAALLEPGYGYFDVDGNPILPADVATKTKVVVRQCTNHSGKDYTTDSGATTHTWTCTACGTEESEKCTFTFDDNGKGVCKFCGNSLTIAVDRDSLKVMAYDETIKPANGSVTVTVGDTVDLTQDIHYTVSYSTRSDVGSASVTVTVTVDGKTYDGSFTEDYTFSKEELEPPVLQWDMTGVTVPVEVVYDGEAVEAGNLPPVIINVESGRDSLRNYLQYSYRKSGDSAYTNGLPTNAGSYDVVVSLPEMEGVYAVSSEPITLTIKKLNPISTAPAAKNLTYNGNAQELVTRGELRAAAAADGAVILFATSKDGDYSTKIPTGITVSNYPVWYKVDATDNCEAVGPTQINGARINHKTITPKVELEYKTTLYDGGVKQPKVTVTDTDDGRVLPDTEYNVTYVDNRDVGTATVKVTNKDKGNYIVNPVNVDFQITLRNQEALSITKQPDTVTYGDKFTLGTSGGSGNGDVTWEITSGAAVAKVDANSGQVTIVGHGQATVKATKSGTDAGVTNYEAATASWTFTADKKPVVAVVTAEDKTFDGNKDAVVHAVVEQGVLAGDKITITGLTGEFEDENAGKNKKVTVSTDNAEINGTNFEHYDISYSSLNVTANINKAAISIGTTPVASSDLVYDKTSQVLLASGATVVTGTEQQPVDVPVEYALSKDGSYSTDFPEAVNAGNYKVWYRVPETANYNGIEPDSVDVSIQKKTITPTVTLNMDSYVYDGTEKKPVVTVEDDEGVIPESNYTVTYSNNINAGTAEITVTANADGNYAFEDITENFTISEEQAKVVTAPKMAGNPLVYNTFAQELVIPGTAFGGTMVYSVNNPDGPYSSDIPTADNAAEYKVYYKVEGDDNHEDSHTNTNAPYVTVTIAPKTVKDPTIELFDGDGNALVSYTYDSTAKKPAVVVKDGSTPIDADEYNVIYSDNTDAGKATVSITDKPGGNYTVSGSATFVIQKADIEFDPYPAAAAIIYDGKSHELLDPGTTSGGEVLYALNSATSTYSAAIPTATEAGNYVVYYKVVGDKNHIDFAVKSVPVTIQRKPLTEITIELTPDSFEYDGKVKRPGITVKDGKTVLPEEEYTVTCTTADGTLAAEPRNEGTYTITITDAANGNYDLTGVTANTADFTIGQTTQAELVIEDKPASTVYGDKFTLSTSGGSGTGTVTWSVTGTAATVDSTTGEVEITGVGKVTIKATNSGDQNYLPISAQWTFTAAPKPVTVTVKVGDKAYDGGTSATVLSAAIDTGLEDGDTVTIDPASIIATFDTPAVGTKTVTLDTSKVKVDGDDAAKYDISYPDTVTASITQATTEITTDPEKISPLTYNRGPQALVTAGETNVGFIVYSLDGTNFSPEIPTGTNAGTYTVHYKVVGTADYTGVGVDKITVTIDPKPITPKIELSKTSYVYDGSKKEPEITVKDDKTVIEDDQYTIDWGTCDQTSEGTHVLTLQDKAGANYTFQEPKTASFTITAASQAALKITGKPTDVYYGDTVTTLDTTGGSGNGPVKWKLSGGTNSTIDETTGVLEVKDTGTLTVTAERAVPNYETVTDTWSFTVKPKPVTAVVTVADKVYDGSNTATVTNVEVKDSDLVNRGDSVLIDIDSLTAEFDDVNVGTNKTVTLKSSAASVTGDTGKYTVSYPAAVTANITAKQLVTVTVTLSDHDLGKDGAGWFYTFDGTEKTPAVTVTGEDADGSAATLAAGDYTVRYGGNKNAGKATVTIESAAGGNYTFTKTEVYFAIRNSAAVLTSTPQAKDLTYNGTDQDLVTVGTATGGTVVYSSTKDGTYSETIPQKTDAGTYTVYYMVKGDENHDDTAPGQVSVTIKPKEIVSPIVTVSGSFTYDGNPQKPANEDADVVVKDGTTPIPNTNYTVSYLNNINAGTATVVITNANGGNYIVNGTGTFIIDKADASVETTPTGKENLPYNGTAQELVEAGSTSDGTMVYSQSENGPYSPVIPTATDVDNYTVWYKVQGDDNHNDSTPDKVTASIITNNVTNPTILVTPEAVTYNGKKQEPTVTVKDNDGLVIDGSEYTVTYVDTSGNTDLTQVGKYTLTITSAGSNYTFVIEDGEDPATFEILPADQTPLDITGTRENVYYGDKFQLSTAGGSGNGTITWNVENPDSSTVASITNGLLEITGVGPVKVTATSSAAGYTDQTAAWSFYADPKPVTAVVTAEAKTYDGKKDATVTAALQSSDLVGDDVITITLAGSFEDANAGTDKKVNVDSSSPKFDGSKGNHDNYNIIYPATTTASILKANATDVTPPEAKTDLEYTGLAQALVEAGSSTEGTLEYSMDNITYSASLPTGTDADSYVVWYRVKGDGNHNDTEGKKLDDSVTIAQQTVTDPKIELSPTGASYDGGVHKPTVTVKDKNGRVIPESEYTVDYGSTDWTNAGDHKVTITDNANGNYIISQAEGTFTILAKGQSTLSILNQPGKVQYGDTFTLSAVGGSGTGAVTWVSSNPDVAQINQNGLVEVLKSGSTTITATKQADGNYGEVSVNWTFSAEKKPVEAVVTAKDKVFNTTDHADLVITWKTGDLLKGDTINLDSVLTGKFDNANVGTNKTVRITDNGNLPTSDKYEITYNTTTTASINPAAASVTPPTLIPNGLTYTGQPQKLVNGGTATNGTILYSLDGIVYGPNVPTGTNAGAYTVWYKVTGNKNYEDVAPDVVPVTIDPKTVSSPVIELSPESFDYDGTAKKPDVMVKDGNNRIPASEYTVSYSNNVQAGTNAKVTISDVDGGNYTVSGTATFTIKSGSAVLTLAPQEKELTYTGRAQALVTAGSAVNGHVEYSTDGVNYSTAIPKGTDADDYDVYYKVVGNAGYSDTDPEFVTVTIAPKQVTPTVLVNGVYNYSTPYNSSAQTPSVTVIVEGKTLASGTDYYISGYDNNRNPGTATVTIQSLGTSNYEFYTTATFEITKAKAEFLMEPEAKTDLVYTGEAQKLVKFGMGQSGTTVVYSLNGGAFYPFVPTATEVGDYVVSAKVQGDEFYADSDTKTYRVTISKNTIAENDLNVILSDDSLKYTGSELKPTVTVRDVENNVISASEYSVTYKNNINVGQADITVTSTGKNYSFNKTVHFTITEGDAPELTITGLPDTVYYGDTLRLSTTGGSGTVTWKVERGNAEAQGSGRFKITGSGPITISATAGGVTKTKDLYADPKPVTAVVTAADKPYDNSTTATLTVTVNSGLVNTDTSFTLNAEGHFTDANAGTNKTVIIDKVEIPEAISAKYDISYPATTTATITPAPLSVTEEGKPKAISSLKYTGQPQALVSEGTAANGTIMYSLDGTSYSYAVPEGTDAKTYTVWYKAVAADENHKDSTPVKITDAAIGVNTDTPTVLCTPNTFQYDGTAKTPTVVVRDSNNRIIPESEYAVTIPSAIAVGEYKVTVTDKTGGNYEFSSSVEGTFKIVASSQNPLSIVTEKPNNVYYGDTFRLSAMGGSGSGAIQWSIAEENAPATIDGNGVVTVTGTDGFTVEAYRKGVDGYSDSNTASVPFVANPKPVTPTVTADDKPYDCKTDATLHAVWKTGDLVNGDTIALTVEGKFVTADVGTNKKVEITSGTPSGAFGNYVITWPDSTTAAISKVDAAIGGAPQPNLGSDSKGLIYTGEAQPLVIAGTTVNGIGKIVYSLSQNGVYSEDIPTATNADTYSVWYKVADSVNYTGIAPAEIKVEIAKATPKILTNPVASSISTGQPLSASTLTGNNANGVPGSFAWAKEVDAPVDGTEYDVVFTPTDADNYETVTLKVPVTVTGTSNPGGSNAPEMNYTPVTSTPSTANAASAPMQTTVQNGTASTVLSTENGSKLVEDAVANRSQNVVIKPEITSEVTKTEVSIPASTVRQIGRETDAALTVSTPIADVTLPSAALSTLSSAGGTVEVVTEQMERGVALTLTAGGRNVESVPGGLTLTVPVEDAAPGTVAVLVHDDGTRETLRKSIVEDDKMLIPLSGSGTVEIVDNSKDFTDVPSTSWASDAVAFASAHELFNGTSETTFSPDQPMSRGMLATVLYNLEGRPEQELTSGFSDVSGDAWYADGVSWATANGITNGYGNGQFGPDDNVTREQFVVMLWKYAGSPEARGGGLGFTDADQASGYALEALSWAVENGILNGYGNGQLDPGGVVTRAQAAQMLKNLLENT